MVFDEASFPYQQPQLPLVAQSTLAAHTDIGIEMSPRSISDSTRPTQSFPITLDSPLVTPSVNPPQSPSIQVTPTQPLLDNPSVTPSANSPKPIHTSSFPSPPVVVPSSKPQTPTISPMSTPPPSPIDPSLLSNSPDTPNPPQKFKSLKTIIPCGREPKPLYSHTTLHPLPHALYADCSDPMSIEPTSFTQVSKYSHWKVAMQDEYDALMRNQTWSLVPASPQMNIVGCKWVFKVKRKADGSIDRYKARLVAKGFNQQEGFDYDETFSSVVKPATIRTILSIVVSLNWSLQQLDVRNAFLNIYLQEAVYMKQSPGFHDSLRPQDVSFIKPFTALNRLPELGSKSQCFSLCSRIFS